MEQCTICGAGEIRNHAYDHHPTERSLYGLATVILPPLNPILPRWSGRFKRLADERCNTPFRGDVHICTQCGYGSLASPPTTEALEEYYKTAYWDRRAPTITDEYTSDPRAQAQVAFSVPHLSKTSIDRRLEIGAGAAYASLLLRDTLELTSSTTHVCEPGSQWADHYKAMNIHRVADLFPFDCKEPYDYIHTSHWLEHVRDLSDTVTALYNHLSSTGHLFVEVPNANQHYWDSPGYDTPHIHFFTLNSLVRLFSNAGFSCLEIIEAGMTPQEQRKQKKSNAERFGENKNGIWLRAIFKKSNLPRL